MTGLAVSLARELNNTGMTTDAVRPRGDFDGFGRSYPFEELRHLVGGPGGLDPLCDGTGRPDNVVCEGQRIVLPRPARVTGLQVVGATEGGSFAEELLLLGDGQEARGVRIGLSDWLAARPAFAEACLATATHAHEAEGDLRGPVPHLWQSMAPVHPPFVCREIRLPANPSMHIFGITLLPVREETPRR